MTNSAGSTTRRAIHSRILDGVDVVLV